MGSYFTPTVIWISAVVLIVAASLAVFHHDAVKGEDNKIQVHTDAVVQHVQEKKNEILNLPRSDARSIDRLQHATFFPTR